MRKTLCIVTTISFLFLSRYPSPVKARQHHLRKQDQPKKNPSHRQQQEDHPSNDVCMRAISLQINVGPIYGSTYLATDDDIHDEHDSMEEHDGHDHHDGHQDDQGESHNDHSDMEENIGGDHVDHHHVDHSDHDGMHEPIVADHHDDDHGDHNYMQQNINGDHQDDRYDEHNYQDDMQNDGHDHHDDHHGDHSDNDDIQEHNGHDHHDDHHGDHNGDQNYNNDVQGYYGHDQHDDHHGNDESEQDGPQENNVFNNSSGSNSYNEDNHEHEHEQDCSGTYNTGVWYFLVGRSQSVNVQFCSTTSNTRMQVFRGDDCDRFSCELDVQRSNDISSLDSNDPYDNCHFSTYITWFALSDEFYYILVHQSSTAPQQPWDSYFTIENVRSNTIEVAPSNSTTTDTTVSNNQIKDICTQPPITVSTAGTIIDDSILVNRDTSMVVGMSCDDDSRVPMQPPRQPAGTWYQVNGTGTTLRASTCSDDDSTNIVMTAGSVFSGECDKIHCALGSTRDNGCDCHISWQSALGERYFLFVYASTTTTTIFSTTTTTTTTSTTNTAAYSEAYEEDELMVDFTLRLTQLQRPVNDGCHGAINVIPTVHGTQVVGSTATASSDWRDPACIRRRFDSGNMWFSVQGTGHQLKATTCVTLDHDADDENNMEGEMTSTTMASAVRQRSRGALPTSASGRQQPFGVDVYSGHCGIGNLACMDKLSSNFSSPKDSCEYIWSSNPEEMYFIRVGKISSSSSSCDNNNNDDDTTFVLTVVEQIPPENDLCENAPDPIVIPVSSAGNATAIIGSTINATQKTLPPCGHQTPTPYAGVFFTAMGTGSRLTATVITNATPSRSTCPQHEEPDECDNRASLSVLSGTTCDTLIDISCRSWENFWSQDSFSWDSVNGEPYSILVYGSRYGLLLDEFELTVVPEEESSSLLVDSLPSSTTSADSTCIDSIDINLFGQRPASSIHYFNATSPLGGDNINYLVDNDLLCPHDASLGFGLESFGDGPSALFHVNGTGNLFSVTVCGRGLYIPTIYVGNECSITSCYNHNTFSLSFDECIEGRGITIHWLTNNNERTYIVVQEVRGRGRGSFEITIDELEPPVNNLCENAIGPLALNEPYYYDLNIMTASPYNHTLVSCNSLISEVPSVWFTVVGTGQKLRASTCRDRNRCYYGITVLSGACGSSNLFRDMLCYDNNVQEERQEHYHERIGTATWNSMEGEIYYLLVYYFDSSNRHFQFSEHVLVEITEITVPENDLCSNAIGPLTVYNNTVYTATIVGATYTAAATNFSLVHDHIDETAFSSPCLTDTFLSPGVWFTVNGSGKFLRVSVCPRFMHERFGIAVIAGSCMDNNSDSHDRNSNPNRNTTTRCIDGSNETPPPYRYPCTMGEGTFFAWPTNANEVYYILVAANHSSGGGSSSFGGGMGTDNLDAGGDFNISVNEYIPPVNAECEDAVGLPLSVNETFVTIGSTLNSRKHDEYTCNSRLRGGDGYGVWYSLIARGNGIRLSACTTDDTIPYHTSLSVYTGGCSNGLFCLDAEYDMEGRSPYCLLDGNAGGRTIGSTLSWLSTPDTVYYILVSTFRGTGSFRLILSEFIPPENDQCDNAMRLEPNSPSLTIGSTINATIDYFNITNRSFCPYSLSSGVGVWYAVVGSAGRFIASTCTSSDSYDGFRTALTVFAVGSKNSDSCKNLTCVHTDRVRCPRGSRGANIQWDTNDGEIYYLFVDKLSSSNLGGVFEMEVIDEPIPTSMPTIMGSGVMDSTASTTSANGCVSTLVEPDNSNVSVVMMGSTQRSSQSIYPGFVDVCRNPGMRIPSPGVLYRFVGIGDTIHISVCTDGIITRGRALVKFYSGECGTEEFRCIEQARLSDCNAAAFEIERDGMSLRTGVGELFYVGVIEIDDRYPIPVDFYINVTWPSFSSHSSVSRDDGLTLATENNTAYNTTLDSENDLDDLERNHSNSGDIAMMYVVNTDLRNYCGHEQHRATKCGGHLASITTIEEDQIINQLIIDTFRRPQRVWIGGNQADEYRSDDPDNQEINPAAGWGWSDEQAGSWNDSVCSNSNGGNNVGNSTSCWKLAEPDNQIRLSFSGREPAYKGQHNIIRQEDGKWTDENGCFGDLAPKLPGVYILPIDYDDIVKYPDCSVTIKTTLSDKRSPILYRDHSSSSFASNTYTNNSTMDNDLEEVFPHYVPQQQQQSVNAKLYVLNLDIRNYCGHEDHRATKCGGHLASITNQTEDNMITDLLILNRLTSGEVWIGGNQAIEFRSDDPNDQETIPAAGYGWSDGSQWWAQCNSRNSENIEQLPSSSSSELQSCWKDGQPDNVIRRSIYGNNNYKGQHNILRAADGKWSDENGCFGDLAPKRPGVYILPMDYANETKYPDCTRDIRVHFASITVGPVLRSHQLLLSQSSSPTNSTNGTINLIGNSSSPASTVQDSTLIATTENGVVNDFLSGFCLISNEPLTIDGSVLIGSMVSATSTFLDPCSSTTSPGVLYNFIGTGGVLELSVCTDQSIVGTVVMLYTGECGAANFSCADRFSVHECDIPSSSPTSWPSVEGEKYYFRVVQESGFTVQEDGSYLKFYVSLTSSSSEFVNENVEVSSNDVCENALVALPTNASITVGAIEKDTIATDVNQKNISSCLPSGARNTVRLRGLWYRVPGTGFELRASTCSMIHSTGLLIFTSGGVNESFNHTGNGPCENLSCIGGMKQFNNYNNTLGLGCNNNNYNYSTVTMSRSSARFGLSLEWDTVLGQIYYIFVYAEDENEASEFTLSSSDNTRTFGLSIEDVAPFGDEGEASVEKVAVVEKEEAESVSTSQRGVGGSDNEDFFAAFSSSGFTSSYYVYCCYLALVFGWVVPFI